MKSIREIASDEYIKKYGPFGVENAQDFAESVITAYLAQMEPIATVQRLIGRTPSISYSQRAITGLAHNTPLYLAPPVPAGMIQIPDVDWLAQVIRCENGNNQMGAGKLAEKIVEAMLAAAKEEGK